jgi:hypothetical protein
MEWCCDIRTLVGRPVGLDVTGLGVGWLVGLLVGRLVGLDVIGFGVGLFVGVVGELME